MECTLFLTPQRAYIKTIVQTFEIFLKIPGQHQQNNNKLVQIYISKTFPSK